MAHTTAMHLSPGIVRAALDAELEPGETVRWTAQPRRSLYALRGFRMVIPGIIVTGFMIFWMTGAAERTLWTWPPSTPMDWFSLAFALLGLPGLAFGLFLVCYPLWRYAMAPGILYAVTNRRALVVKFGREPRIDTFPPDVLHDLTVRERPDGAGDIFFEMLPRHQVLYREDAEGDDIEETGFLALPNVREAQGALDKLRQTDPSQR